MVANKREVVDTVLAVRFPDEIEEAYRARVLNVIPPAAIVIAVDSVESPDWITIYDVEKEDWMIVLNVEKAVRKLDVAPILVDKVLNEVRQTLDRLAMDVDRVESCLPMSLLALVSPITVDKEEIPDWSVKKFVVMTVLKVDMVETSCPVKVELFDPPMVEKVENPA